MPEPSEKKERINRVRVGGQRSDGRWLKARRPLPSFWKTSDSRILWASPKAKRTVVKRLRSFFICTLYCAMHKNLCDEDIGY